ncbi:hypothetical protein CLOP_g15237 [Closterium sp. NIES-67]|nr:hypothetical protein CLOP_g15237 [Closterium sp. NIES-67]
MVLSAWYADVSRSLPLAAFGVPPMPLPGEPAWFGVMRLVYTFLHEKAFINLCKAGDLPSSPPHGFPSTPPSPAAALAPGSSPALLAPASLSASSTPSAPSAPRPPVNPATPTVPACPAPPLHGRRVVVVGAGPAGLTAARHLVRLGAQVVVLEARERVGGRVHTDWTSLSVPVDLGASIITGAAPDVHGNLPPDLSALLCQQAGLPCVVLRDACPLYDAVSGGKVAVDVDARVERQFNRLLDDLAAVAAQQGQAAVHMSMAQGVMHTLGEGFGRENLQGVGGSLVEGQGQERRGEREEGRGGVEGEGGGKGEKDGAGREACAEDCSGNREEGSREGAGRSGRKGGAGGQAHRAGMTSSQSNDGDNGGGGGGVCDAALCGGASALSIITGGRWNGGAMAATGGSAAAEEREGAGGQLQAQGVGVRDGAGVQEEQQARADGRAEVMVEGEEKQEVEEAGDNGREGRELKEEVEGKVGMVDGEGRGAWGTEVTRGRSAGEEGRMQEEADGGACGQEETLAGQEVKQQEQEKKQEQQEEEKQEVQVEKHEEQEQKLEEREEKHEEHQAATEGERVVAVMAEVSSAGEGGGEQPCAHSVAHAEESAARQVRGGARARQVERETDPCGGGGNAWDSREGGCQSTEGCGGVQESKDNSAEGLRWMGKRKRAGMEPTDSGHVAALGGQGGPDAVRGRGAVMARERGSKRARREAGEVGGAHAGNGAEPTAEGGSGEGRAANRSGEKGSVRGVTEVRTRAQARRAGRLKEEQGVCGEARVGGDGEEGAAQGKEASKQVKAESALRESVHGQGGEQSMERTRGPMTRRQSRDAAESDREREGLREKGWEATRQGASGQAEEAVRAGRASSEEGAKRSAEGEGAGKGMAAAGSGKAVRDVRRRSIADLVAGLDSKDRKGNGEGGKGKSWREQERREVERRVLGWHFANLEYGCATDLTRLSLPFWNQDDAFGGFGGPHCMVKGGFAHAMTQLAEGVDVRLGQQVTHVAWGGGEGEGGAGGKADERGGGLEGGGSEKPCGCVAGAKGCCVSSRCCGAGTGASMHEAGVNGAAADMGKVKGMADTQQTHAGTNGHAAAAAAAAGAVHVRTASGEVFPCDAALITVPLGCLKAKAVAFSPALPAWKARAIERLGFGTINKVILEFDRAFWDPHVDYFGAVGQPQPAQRGNCFLFWNLQRTCGAPVLAALVRKERVVQHALNVLKTIFGRRNVPKPKAAAVTFWGSDPFSLGAYSYVPVGASGRDYDLLARPVQARLFFAGEATSREHPDTVGGAMLSGRREAVRIAGVLQGAGDVWERAEALAAAVAHRQTDEEREEGGGEQARKQRERESTRHPWADLDIGHSACVQTGVEERKATEGAGGEAAQERGDEHVGAKGEAGVAEVSVQVDEGEARKGHDGPGETGKLREEAETGKEGDPGGVTPHAVRKGNGSGSVAQGVQAKREEGKGGELPRRVLEAVAGSRAGLERIREWMTESLHCSSSQVLSASLRLLLAAATCPRCVRSSGVASAVRAVLVSPRVGREVRSLASRLLRLWHVLDHGPGGPAAATRGGARGDGGQGEGQAGGQGGGEEGGKGAKGSKGQSHVNGLDAGVVAGGSPQYPHTGRQTASGATPAAAPLPPSLQDATAAGSTCTIAGRGEGPGEASTPATKSACLEAPQSMAHDTWGGSRAVEAVGGMGTRTGVAMTVVAVALEAARRAAEALAAGEVQAGKPASVAAQLSPAAGGSSGAASAGTPSASVVQRKQQVTGMRSQRQSPVAGGAIGADGGVGSMENGRGTLVGEEGRRWPGLDVSGEGGADMEEALESNRGDAAHKRRKLMQPVIGAVPSGVGLSGDSLHLNGRGDGESECESEEKQRGACEGGVRTRAQARASGRVVSKEGGLESDAAAVTGVDDGKGCVVRGGAVGMVVGVGRPGVSVEECRAAVGVYVTSLLEPVRDKQRVTRQQVREISRKATDEVMESADVEGCISLHDASLSPHLKSKIRFSVDKYVKMFTDSSRADTESQRAKRKSLP